LLQFNMSLERRQLICPRGLRGVQPGGEFGHRLTAQTVDSDSGVVGRVPFLDQAAFPQRLEVTTGRGRGKIQCAGHVSRRSGRGAQQIDDGAPMRISQGRQGAIEASSGCSRRHDHPVIFVPELASASSRVTALTVWPTVQIWPSMSRQR